MAYTCVRVIFEIGHEATIRSKVTPKGFTHDWQLFVRGADNTDINHFVDKVIFYLHDSFPNPRRVIKEAPYIVRESGYAGFPLPIEIYLKNKQEPFKIRFKYQLTLQDVGPPITSVVREKYIFNNPTEDFRRKLIKGGGIGVGADSAVALAASQMSTGPALTAADEQKSSNKNKFTSPPDAVKKPPKKESTVKEDLNANDPFSIFGQPIKTSAIPISQKNTSSSSSSSTNKFSSDKTATVSTPAPTSQPADKISQPEKQAHSSKISKHNSSSSSHKDKDREKDRAEKEKVKEQRDKDKDKISSKKNKDDNLSKKDKSMKDDVNKTPTKINPKDDSSKKYRDDRSSKEKSEKEAKSERKDKEKKRKDEKKEKSKDKHKNEKKESESKDYDERLEKLGFVKEEDKKSYKDEKEEKYGSKDKFVETKFTTSYNGNIPNNGEVSHNSGSSKKEEKHKHHKHKKDKSKKDSKRDREEKSDRPKERKEGTPKERPPPHVDVEKVHQMPHLKAESPKLPKKPLNQLFEELLSEKSDDSDLSITEDEGLLASFRTKGTPPAKSSPMKFEPPPPVLVDSRSSPSPSPPQPPKRESPVHVKEEELPHSGKKKKKSSSEEKKRKRKSKTKDEDGGPSGRKMAKYAPPSPLPPPPAVMEMDRTTSSEEQQDLSEDHAPNEQESRVGSLSPTVDTKFTDEYVTKLKELQQKIMTLEDNSGLQRIVQVVAETGQYEITTKTFDFDLCSLDKTIVQRLLDLFLP